MHMFTRPVPLMCTGLLSALVNCPGVVCQRERSRRKADTRKNEDGNVTRNVCINIVACLPAFCFVKYQVHPLYVSNKMSISLLAACVDMSGTFKVAVSFASTFQCTSRTFFLERSRGAFRGGVVSAFFQEQLHAHTTHHSWQLAQKKKTESSPKSIVTHAHHSHVNDYRCSRRAACGN